MNAPVPEAAMAGLIARAREQPVPVITLTDEELAGLDGGPAARPVAPQPWLDAQDDSSRQLICQVALRGLAARGIVVPSGAEVEGRNLAVIHQDLAAVLLMRRFARAIVLAQRRTSAECRFRMLHLHDDAVLEEDVSPGGLHGLTVTSAATAARRLAVFVDPSPATGRRKDGQALTVPLADIARGDGLRGLDDVRWVTAVGRVDAGGTAGAAQRRLTVYALPGRVVVAEPARAGGGETALTLTAVGAATLERRLATLLAPDPEA